MKNKKQRESVAKEPEHLFVNDARVKIHNLVQQVHESIVCQHLTFGARVK